MTNGTVLSRRLIAAASVCALSLSVAAPAPATGASHDVDLLAVLELPEGDVMYDLDLGTLHVFDDEDVPFVIQVIDGCAVNDRMWIFGAGLSAAPAPISIVDRRTGENARAVLPARTPGETIETVLDPEALDVCKGRAAGGLPAIEGTGTFISAKADGVDFTDDIVLLSEGRADAYETLARSGYTSSIISRGQPIVAVDDVRDLDELYLLIEGRTPRVVEGVVFQGREGMLPDRNRLGQLLKGINKSRVRRAFETAKIGKAPRGIIADLKLKGVEQVHHVTLDMDSFGADAYLAEAGWIKRSGPGLELPQPVEERFTVEVVRADGASERLPLVGPMAGSQADGQLWTYASPEYAVEIIDGCSLSGTFWTVAAGLNEEPVELLVTDTLTGASTRPLLWTDRRDVSHVVDTSTLTACS